MTTAPVELIPMVCLRCRQPLTAQPDEVVWICPTCGQGLVLSDAQGLLPLVIHFAPGIDPAAKGKPVWVAPGQVSLQRETFSGDKSQEMLEFWAQPRWFYIPAYSLSLDTLVESGVGMLRQPLPLQETGTTVLPQAPFFQAAPNSPPSNEPRAHFREMLPVTLKPEDVYPIAEYVILAIEAERRDQLKSLSFNLQLGQPELCIFP